MRYSEKNCNLLLDKLTNGQAMHSEEYLYQNLRNESPPGSLDEDGLSDIIAGTVPGNIGHKHSYVQQVRRKCSIGSGRGNVLSSPKAMVNLCSINTGKTQSLPASCCIKNCDTVILNALRVQPEELAKQITLLDFSTFCKIQPDELTSCAWTKKEKHINTPNIVAFTKRFNHTTFWTVEEILSSQTPKARADIIIHFIKIAKKLLELNNLHSLFAIVTALQSASIFRLKKTWEFIPKKDKQAFERLADIFNDRNNWGNLREYIESLRLPCIPYLGLFLTDFIYIDIAHPHLGGLESEQRKNKMNNILRVISNYQQSDYTNILASEEVQRYIKSIRYIEELQNIFEEDQYKKSLALEPVACLQSSSSCSSKESFNAECSAIASLNLSPAKSGSVRVPPSATAKSRPTHRKCRSLGSNIFSKGNSCQGNSHLDSANSSNNLGMRHPLDDSFLEHKAHEESMSEVMEIERGNEASNCLGKESFEGSIRRKTLLKDGRKPAVASWQRYWLQIWANSLIYFPPKSFKGNERSDFKREPCKVCSLNGWLVHDIDKSKHKSSFQLFNVETGTLYKFRADSPDLWTTAIKNAARKNIEAPLPTNLMTFE